MTILGYSLRIGSSLSFRRKCASSSPTSFDSSFASAIRDGATQRFGCVDGTMTSANVHVGSAIASYTLRVIAVTSMYDIVLFACGSRSTSRVLAPRRERAAARLMAVVVFPTPPFWLAIATIISCRSVSWQEVCGHCRKRVRGCQSKGRMTQRVFGCGGCPLGYGRTVCALRHSERGTLVPRHDGARWLGATVTRR